MKCKKYIYFDSLDDHIHFIQGYGVVSFVPINSSLTRLIFTDFRSGKAPILVATDVAARGLGM